MDTTLALSSEALVHTTVPSRYLQQLCKHFAHRCPVTVDEVSGHIAFDAGNCHLKAAGGTLQLIATAAGDAQLEQVQDVVARHLVRFAFREELTIDWHKVMQ